VPIVPGTRVRSHKHVIGVRGEGYREPLADSDEPEPESPSFPTSSTHSASPARPNGC
jgi:hypothetical protein